MDKYIRKVTEVIRVLDGDTVEMMIDLGQKIYSIHTYRLNGFDAPETWRPLTESERAGGKLVTQFLVDTLEVHKENLFIQTSKDPKIYGRYSATFFVPSDNDIININELVATYMTENGLTKEELRNYRD